ncbi:SAM-dependent methyltransferase [Microaerobacter geothermalis]|uniref:class I SAM-dependent methyltransferase n=1 Tax=Microaerobacter geothermalis TaxID=674972 RepID=UPI001F3E551D|nr:SAM-dependent methyltransferase [Microaerobacter geothermalis]MCF6093564.1 SAM-dependent methyltransferase [Microaerobacter geothermalis]
MNRALIKQIKKEIDQSDGQGIPFYRFMELSLYHEENGYYSTNRTKIGKKGDFYTSSHVGTVFGETLADIFYFWLRTHGELKQIAEMGSGDGRLARQILDHMQQVYPELYHDVQYFIIERSEYHKGLQKEWLSSHIEKVVWIKDIHQGSFLFPDFTGVFFSNELLDAFPVQLVEYHHGQYYEIYVDYEGEGENIRFVERKLPLKKDELLHYISDENITFSNGQRIEINLDMKEWIKSISQWMKRGILLTIDYGYEAEELYHPVRKNGTLRGYYKHQLMNNPYIYVGEQDLTAHINFSTLKRWGNDHGFSSLYYGTQGDFLMAGGILNKLKDHHETDPFQGESMRRNRAIRQLIFPEGMGLIFKVLIQGKGIQGEKLFEDKPVLWNREQ